MIDFEEQVLYGVKVNADAYIAGGAGQGNEVSLTDICQQFNYEDAGDLEDRGPTPRVTLGPKVGTRFTSVTSKFE